MAQAQPSSSLTPVEDMRLVNNCWVHVDAKTGLRRKYDEAKKEWVQASEEDFIEKNGATSAQPQAPAGSNYENMQQVGPFGVWVHREPDTGRVRYYDTRQQCWVIPAEEELDEGTDDVTSDVQAAKDETPKALKTKRKGNDSEEEFDSDEEEEAWRHSKEEADTGDTNAEDVDVQIVEEKRRKAMLARKRKQPNTFVCPQTNTVYCWSEQTNAWQPELDDDFIAMYQANYGIEYDEKQLKESAAKVIRPMEMDRRSTSPEDIDVDKEEEEESKVKQQSSSKPTEKGEKKQKSKRRKDKEGWAELDESQNRNVYVSNMPTDIDEEQFAVRRGILLPLAFCSMQEFMSKCGVIDIDPLTNKPKVKLYKDAEGRNKGDGRCCYLKVESIDLALQILDEADWNGRKVHIERAKFEMRGEFDANKRRKITRRQAQQHQKQMDKYLNWAGAIEDLGVVNSERPVSDKLVVVKNLFTVEELMKDATKLLECEELLREECGKYGKVKRVKNNPDGVAMVTYATPQEADNALTMLDYRMLRGRQLRAERWDGKTRYKVKETAEQEQARIDQWHKYLEEDED